MLGFNLTHVSKIGLLVPKERMETHCWWKYQTHVQDWPYIRCGLYIHNPLLISLLHYFHHTAVMMPTLLSLAVQAKLASWQLFSVLKDIPYNMHMVLLCLALLWLYHQLSYACWVHVIHLPIFFRVASLALWQSYDCHSASEVTQKNMGKSDQQQNTKANCMQKLLGSLHIDECYSTFNTLPYT